VERREEGRGLRLGGSKFDWEADWWVVAGCGAFLTRVRFIVGTHSVSLFSAGFEWMQ
jgi:hypothetical protein